LEAVILVEVLILLEEFEQADKIKVNIINGKINFLIIVYPSNYGFFNIKLAVELKNSYDIILFVYNYYTMEN
jgi:hypothetical protein